MKKSTKSTGNMFKQKLFNNPKIKELLGEADHVILAPCGFLGK